jgi:hypothetical protein
MQKIQRNLLTFSDEKRRDGLLRTAWSQITFGFKSMPEPKSSWYETATGDLTPWRKMITPIRAAVLAAVRTGDQKLIDQTLEGARAFCRELEADFTSLVPATAEGSVAAIALVETECEGAANVEEVALVASPTPTQAERAVGPLSRHIAALVSLVDKCRRLAREARPVGRMQMLN